MTNQEEITIWRGLLSLLVSPFLLLFMFGVELPFLVARKIWRWYRLPLEQRLAIRAKERKEFEQKWEEIEAITKTELLMHGLPDTPANRAILNSGKARRRR